jgi:translocation and assembly module TamB
MKIGVGRIDGSLYGAMTIAASPCPTRGRVLLGADGAARLAAVRLSQQPCRHPQPGAPTATLARLPQFRATPPSDGPLLPDLDISIGRLKVDRLVIGPSVTGERGSARSTGAPASPTAARRWRCRRR